MPVFPASLQSGRILVRLPPGADRDEYEHLAGKVDGRRKHPRGWTFPATLRVARQLRVEFGSGLTLDSSLWVWGRSERAREAELRTLAASLQAEVPSLQARVPRFYDGLRGDQRAGIAWLLRATEDGGVILGDKAGLGKTREYIGWAFARPEPEGDHLIIAPRLSLRATWERELRLLEEDLPGEVAIFAPGAFEAGSKRDKEMARWEDSSAPYRFVLTIPRMLDYWEEDDGTRRCSYPGLFAWKWNTVAVDESHKMLGALTVKKGPRYARGLLELDVDPSGRLPMSGTPFGRGGRAKGMFGAHMWMRPAEFTSFWRWAERRLDVESETVFIKGRENKFQRIGGVNEAYWPTWSRELDTLMLRRTKDEVGLNLPPIVHIDFKVDLAGPQEKAYRKLEKDAAVAIEGGRVLPVNVLSEMLRLKQFSGASWRVVDYGGKTKMEACLPSVKFDALLDLLSERGIDADWEAGGEKVTIGSQFVPILEMVQRELAAIGVPSYLIVGAPTEEHDEMVREFQGEGGKPVLLMTLQKGTSIDLDRADTTVMWDLLWNPDDNSQWVDRHQRSRPTPLTAIRLVAENAIDGYIIAVNADKEDIQHRVLDGRRGIEFAKRILNVRRKGTV